MRISGELNKAQLKELQEAIKKLEMPPKKKQRLLWRIAKLGMIPAIKRNVKEQKDFNGSGFKKRKGKRKSPLLKKIAKHIVVREMPAIEAVKLYFKGHYKSTSDKNTPIGVVADVQQNGRTIRQNAKQFKKQSNSKKKGSITKQQIKKLRELGHTHSKKGKEVKSSVKWLRENYSKARAGVVIKRMVDELVKQFWSVKIPSRAFMGVTDNEFSKILERQLKNISFGWDVKAQNIKRGKIK